MPVLVRFGRVLVPKVWGDIRFVNYFVAFIPTILSILFAFVIDKDLEHHVKKMWRFSIIGCGILYSAALWHQQSLTDQNNLATQKSIVNDAVSKANAHSDEKFAGVQSNVGTVQDEVEDIGESLGTLESKIEKATGDINTSIGKVGKPDPPIPAKLLFTLWRTTGTTNEAKLSETAQPDSEGNFAVDFTIMNVSDTTAEAIDIWIQICDVCSFAKEPAGFEKVPGALDQVRHRMLSSLNPGVSFEKTTIIVNASTVNAFQIALHYSCKTCGGQVTGNQIATITKGAPQALRPQ